jgi:sulfur carrier protein
MFVYVNSNRQELPDQAKITTLFEALNIASQRGIAIAINNEVIPKAEWEAYQLQADDKLTLIKATQGG